MRLEVGQIHFLASYLYRSLEISGNDGKISEEQIINKLFECSTQPGSGDFNRESLYEYLEDFAFITDPMFDLFLTSLI